MARKKKRAKAKVCEKCETVNPEKADRCASCGGTRFAPPFVKQLRHVNRQVFVQLTEPPEIDGKRAPDRITLYKWWPGDRASFNIPDASQWERIKEIIDQDLAPILGWSSTEEAHEAITAASKAEKATRRQLSSIAKGDPSLIPRLLKGIDLSKVDPGDYSRLGDALGEIASVYVNADEGLQLAIRRLVKNLPEQGESAIRQLAELMETLTLSQITAVTREVNRRMELLRTFKQRIRDERTYEIRGPGSIHRLLEQAMWIVDERYWLMHSNEQLRAIVGDEIVKKNKKDEKRRPDFVCGTVDNRLIVVEIKRPSHKLTIADLNQLEDYVDLIEDHLDFNGYEATLVGKAVPADVRRRLKRRSRAFRATTYTQLLGDAERRYSEYLKALESTD